MKGGICVNKKDYELLIKNLDKVISECQDIDAKFSSSEAVLKWTIKEYQNNCNKARELQSKTDIILKTDCYHIIGMGNLSVSQSTRFIKKIKTLGELRSKIKVLASVQDVMVPNIPKSSEYKCSLLNDKKLVRKK